MFVYKTLNRIKIKRIFNFSLLMILNVLLINFAIPISSAESVKQNENSDYGLPTHRRDGGSRGIHYGCINGAKSNLVALIPEKIVGINASTSPKLFFYVPKIKSQKTLEFVLRDEQDELIYEAFITTKGEGIMTVDIPEEVQVHSTGKDANYRWYLSMICNSKQRSRDIVVEGWMHNSQVDPKIQQKLDNADLVAQADMYHEEGFWYDALSVLANDHQSKTQESVIRAKWSELLESIGLEKIASEPFIESELIEFSIKK